MKRVSQDGTVREIVTFLDEVPAFDDVVVLLGSRPMVTWLDGPTGVYILLTGSEAPLIGWAPNEVASLIAGRVVRGAALLLTEREWASITDPGDTG